MPYRTQATVMVSVDTSTTRRVTLKPTQDYTIKDKDNSYTVFVDDTKKSIIFTLDQTFSYDSSNGIDQLLIQAAFANTCLEITIGDSSENVANIIGVTIPAKFNRS